MPREVTGFPKNSLGFSRSWRSPGDPPRVFWCSFNRSTPPRSRYAAHFEQARLEDAHRCLTPVRAVRQLGRPPKSFRPDGSRRVSTGRTPSREYAYDSAAALQARTSKKIRAAEPGDAHDCQTKVNDRCDWATQGPQCLTSFCIIEAQYRMIFPFSARPNAQ